MVKWQDKPPSKEARAQAEAAFKKSSADEAKAKTLRDLQEAEASALGEKTERLKALRLAREAGEE